MNVTTVSGSPTLQVFAIGDDGWTGAATRTSAGRRPPPPCRAHRILRPDVGAVDRAAHVSGTDDAQAPTLSLDATLPAASSVPLPAATPPAAGLGGLSFPARRRAG